MITLELSCIVMLTEFRDAWGHIHIADLLLVLVVV